jgi:oligopeptide transport system substrate-binding protein
MDRTLLGISTAFAAALLLVGLTFSRSVDPPADLRFVNGTEPKTLDPQLMTGQPEGRIAEALFEGLTRHDAKTLRPAPGAAESWEVSGDGKRYTFHLRADMRWTDGHPVTAEDFVYSWKRLLEPKLASEYAYIIFPVRHAQALNTFDGHAEALTGPIRAAASALLTDHSSGLDARDWQRFLAKNHVHDPLRHEANPKLAELLGRREGGVTRDELAWFRDAVAGAATSLREGARAARAHFGVDEGLFAPDPRTLVVELRAPTPYFLEITSFYPTLPSPRWLTEDPKRHDDWFLPDHIVSNGPFTLKRWIVNDHIRLERSESYWGRSEVHAGAVEALAIESDTTALNLYLTHEIDWLPEQYPKDLTEELKHRPDFHATPGMIVYFYRFNTTRPPFDDRRVRMAVNLAVDRKLIVEEVLGLGQIAARTFVPPGMAGYEPPESPIRLDLPRARALLAEAGYPDGKGFPEVGILYNTNQGHKKVAEVITDQLRKNLGIRVNAYNQEWQSFLNTVRTLDYGMARAGWIGDYADPNTFLDMWVTNGGNNQTGWSSPLYDRLIQTAADVSTFIADPEPLLGRLAQPEDLRPVLEAARHAGDPADRIRAQARLRMLLLREAEAILVREELPILPLYFYVVGNLFGPAVRGLYTTLAFEDGKTAPNLQDIHPLRDIWVDRAGGSGAR